MIILKPGNEPFPRIKSNQKLSDAIHSDAHIQQTKAHVHFLHLLHKRVFVDTILIDLIYLKRKLPLRTSCGQLLKHVEAQVNFHDHLLILDMPRFQGNESQTLQVNISEIVNCLKITQQFNYNYWVLVMSPVADPGFPRRGCQSLTLGQNLFL